MNGLLKTETLTSEKNGQITIRWLFGRTKVFAFGYEQGSKYLADLWAGAIRRIPKRPSVKTILVLGLGGGSSLRRIHRRFPHASLTIVEWDPAMVDAANRLEAFKGMTQPEIIVGDAVEVVTSMRRRFDVILIDLYTGGVPEPRLSSDAFLQGLARILGPSGFLVVNVFRSRDLIPLFTHHFLHSRTWTFKYNTVALFRPISVL